MNKKYKKKLSVICAVTLLLSGCFVNFKAKAAEEDVSQRFVVDDYTGKQYSECSGVPAKENYVFAGWFTAKECEKDTALKTVPGELDTVYAKFVSQDVLTVKVQLQYGTNRASETARMRLVTTVDSLDYAEVGFDIQCGDKKLSCVSKTVYETLHGYTDVNQESYKPSMISNASRYFVTQNITNFPHALFGDKIIVTPKWTTLDGTTVDGNKRTFTITEGFDGKYGVGYRTLLDPQVDPQKITIKNIAATASVVTDETYGSVYQLDVTQEEGKAYDYLFTLNTTGEGCKGETNSFFSIYNPTDSELYVNLVAMDSAGTSTGTMGWLSIQSKQWRTIRISDSIKELNDVLGVYLPAKYKVKGQWKITGLYKMDEKLSMEEAGYQVSAMIDALPEAEEITRANLIKYVDVIQKTYTKYQSLTDVQKAVLSTNQKHKLTVSVAKVDGINTVLDATTNNMSLDNRSGVVDGTVTKGTDAAYGPVVKLDITKQKGGCSFFTVNDDTINREHVFFYVYNPTGNAVSINVYNESWGTHCSWKTLLPGWNLVELLDEKKSSYVFSSFPSTDHNIAGEWLVTGFYGYTEETWNTLKVSEMIESLPSTTTTTDFGLYINKIQEAKAAYDALTSKEGITVTQKEKLNTCVAKNAGIKPAFDATDTEGVVTYVHTWPETKGEVTAGKTDAICGSVYEMKVTANQSGLFSVMKEKYDTMKGKTVIFYVYNPTSDAKSLSLTYDGASQVIVSWQTVNPGWNRIEFKADYDVKTSVNALFPSDSQDIKGTWKVTGFYTK